MPTIQFGSSWESFDKAPLQGMRALASIGFSFVRLWIFWDSTNPEPGVYDWSKVDADIAAITGAGLKVYANLLWAPKWASQGQPTYLPYTAGCSAWNDPNDGSKGIRFADEYPYCSNAAHITAQNVRDFGVALAARHGDKIWCYASWNEPGGPMYWPCIKNVSLEEGIKRLQEEVTIPFTDGIRSVQKNAKFAGIEADGASVLDESLRQESDRGLHLFDSISFHPYSWGVFPQDSYKRIDTEFMPATTAHRNGRPIWYSEIGDDGTGKLMEWTQTVVSTRDVALINYHDFKQWFQPGTWDNGTYVPNALNTQMTAYIASVHPSAPTVPPTTIVLKEPASAPPV